MTGETVLPEVTVEKGFVRDCLKDINSLPSTTKASKSKLLEAGVKYPSKGFKSLPEAFDAWGYKTFVTNDGDVVLSQVSERKTRLDRFLWLTVAPYTSAGDSVEVGSFDEPPFLKFEFDDGQLQTFVKEWTELPEEWWNEETKD